MKTKLQLAASTLALAGLLAAAASSQATDLAELPLKASVLAKPNVIFGMDDSGSMDFEVMVYANDGAFWWDYNAGKGWGVDSAHPNSALRTLTAPWFNASGASSSQWRKMSYLFPNGSGDGNRVLTDSANEHFAIMPTTEFAFLRWAGVYYDSTTAKYKSAPTDPAASTSHNPLYYNTLVTYAPWAPAQLSTGAVTPGAASLTQAKSHPMYGSGTFNLTSDIFSTNTNAVFTAFPKMTLPAKTSAKRVQRQECKASDNTGCTSWSDVTTQGFASDSKLTRVAMDYYAPTFWVKETCTVPATVNVASDNCTTAPDGSTLKRYEIKSTTASYPSGRSYTDEIQNFANWFQYFRKRKLMLAAAMGETMENLTGMRLGVAPFNNLPTNVKMYDADAKAADDNRLRVAGIFYEANGSGGTPTRETLKYIGGQFKRTDTDSVTGKYNMIQYACQRNNAFIVTDGFAYNSNVTPPAWDQGKSAADWGTGAPYAQSFTHDGTIADLALRYYTNNPRPLLSKGKLQATPTDANTDLHMNTYGLVLGARGTLYLGESSVPPTTAGAWPDPNADRNPTSVDDLWHATLNGRGKMYLANSPEETALRIRAGLDDILSQEGAQGGVAVSAVNLDRSDGKAYLGYYNQRGWTGDLEARTIDVATAVISAPPTAPVWSAGTLLNARTTARAIFSSGASSGLEFTDANFGATVRPDSSYDSAEVVAYLRGTRTGEGTTFRQRNSLLGPVVNSEPVLARDEQVVYVASGEGMLHAFATSDGSEQWAYLPPDGLTEVGKSVQRGWVYRTLLDATPVYGKLGTGKKMLIGGLGAAGRSYYALDVSSPRGLSQVDAAKQFKWLFPAANDSNNRALVGYTVGKPVLARTAANGDVVLVTSGYDNGLGLADGKGRLWMLNATTGAVIKTFVTADGAVNAEAGLAHVAAFREADGNAKYAYGGDLLGNVWRFDLTSTTTGEIPAQRIATLLDANGKAQPITSTPELTTLEGKRVVLVGTGRLLDIGDFGSTSVQTFYAFNDGALLTNARTTLTQRVYARGGNPEVSGGAPDWKTGRGWYMDLPDGEQVNTDPSVASGAIVFVGNKNGGSDCVQSAWLYIVDLGSGGPLNSVTYVSQQLSANATSSRPVVLRDKNGNLHVTVQMSDRSIVKKPLPPLTGVPPAKNAWREIRR